MGFEFLRAITENYDGVSIRPCYLKILRAANIEGSTALGFQVNETVFRLSYYNIIAYYARLANQYKSSNKYKKYEKKGFNSKINKNEWINYMSLSIMIDKLILQNFTTV